jgi:hypothetical protein
VGNLISNVRISIILGLSAADYGYERHWVVGSSKKDKCIKDTRVLATTFPVQISGTDFGLAQKTNPSPPWSKQQPAIRNTIIITYTKSIYMS